MSTYQEYKAVVKEKKHILVFVSLDIKKGFESILSGLKKLYEMYINDSHRLPSSPFDLLKSWIEQEINNGGIASQVLKKADPFIGAFLFEIYHNKECLYDFDIPNIDNNALKISQMLNTSLRSVVSLIPEREHIDELKKQVDYLLSYADYTLVMLDERSRVSNNDSKINEKSLWSSFLEQGITFLNSLKILYRHPYLIL